MKTKFQNGAEQVVGGIGFEDGSCIDLVLDGSLRLALWDGQLTSIAEKFSIRGKSYVPGELDSMASAIYFPRRVCLDENLEKLRADVQIELGRLAFLDRNYVALLTGLIFTSWFADAFVAAPSVVLVRGGADEVNHCFRLLNCLCRRPLLVAHCDGRTFNNLPLRYQPTLLISHVVGEDVVAALQSTSQGPAKYFHRGELFDAPIMKVMPSSVLESCGNMTASIPIVLQPIRADKFPAQNYYDNLREEFQARLLGHRLKNLHAVRKAAWISDRTSGPMGPVLDALTICTPNISANVQSIFCAQEKELALEREAQPDYVVCEAALVFCHDKARTQAMVSEIGNSANSISAQRGSPLNLTARAAGHQLKRLGIRVVRLGADGRGINFDGYTRKKIHKIASQLEVPSTRERQAGCPHCVADMAS